MRTSLLPLILVTLAAATARAGAQSHSYAISARDSVSVNPTAGIVYRDNLIRVATHRTNPSLADVNGLLSFDVSSIPDCEVVTAASLEIKLDTGAPNPFNGPRMEIYHSVDDRWTRSSATASSGTLDNLVSAVTWIFPGPGAVLAVPLDVSSYDFSPDLLDNAITLVLDNVNVLNSQVNFVGPYGTPSATPIPILRITTSIPPGCGCTGTIAVHGSGCNDSFGQPVSLVLSGCAKLGDTLLATTNMSAGVSGPVFMPLGLSDAWWNGLGLPLSLGPLGAPGCYLYVSQEVMLGPLSGSSGAVSTFLFIPPMPVLVNAQLYIQSLIVDLGANRLNLVTSDYWDLVIGS